MNIFSRALLIATAAASLPAQSIDGNWQKTSDGWIAKGNPSAKQILETEVPTEFALSGEIRLDSGQTQAGIVFAANDFAPGANGFEGYYLGANTRTQQIIWGMVKNGTWREIARKPSPVKPGVWHRFRIEFAEGHLRAWVNAIPVAPGRFPKIDGLDINYKKGAIALRVLGKSAQFRNFELKPFTPEKLTASYQNPVQPGCADPVILLHKGTYYAYCTYTPSHPRMVDGIRLYTSKNLADWEDRGFVLKNKDSWGNSRFWAPDIVERDGIFYLYYAVDQRIAVATSDSPLGPFKQKVQRPMEPGTIRIDAHVFEDDDGQRYFYYVHFNHGNEIWAGKLDDDMVSVDPSSLQLMVRADQPWERDMAPIVEGPEIIKHHGVYYLTYSGSHFQSPDYAVGYATSSHPLGPWEKYTHNPIMKSTAYAKGTAHHTLTTSPDGTERFIVYHRHFDLKKTEPRQMAVDRIQFVPQPEGPDVLEIWGPTVTPQPLPSGAPSSAMPSPRK